MTFKFLSENISKISIKKQFMKKNIFPIDNFFFDRSAAEPDFFFLMALGLKKLWTGFSSTFFFKRVRAGGVFFLFYFFRCSDFQLIRSKHSLSFSKRYSKIKYFNKIYTGMTTKKFKQLNYSFFFQNFFDI